MAVDFQLVGHLVWSTEIIRSLFFFLAVLKHCVVSCATSERGELALRLQVVAAQNCSC